MIKFTAVRESAAVAVANSPEIVALLAGPVAVYREIYGIGNMQPVHGPAVVFGPFSASQLDRSPDTIEHVMPVAVLFTGETRPEPGADGVFRIPASDIFDKFSALVESTVSRALTDFGAPFDHESYLPEENPFPETIAAWWLYKIRLPREPRI